MRSRKTTTSVAEAGSSTASDAHNHGDKHQNMNIVKRSGTGEDAVTALPAMRRPSRLPKALQFPLIVVLHLAISSLGYSFLHQWSGNELVTIAKTPGTWSEWSLLAGWRVYVASAQCCSP